MRKAKHLKRERINALLSAITEFPLTIVEAPAGYGKTTAVREFLIHNKIDSLWISFRPVSKPYEYFWTIVTDNIVKMESSIGVKLKSLGAPVDIIQCSKILSLINRLEFDRTIAVVLDNFEMAADPLLVRLIFMMAEERIENLHFVIVTRDISQIDYISLLSRERCIIISQQQLKFTKDEVQEYCSLMGSCAVAEDIQRIADYTDGWISMIYILLLGLEVNIPIGMSQTLDELIDKTLYCTQPEDIRHFLQQLSVMDGFTAAQAAFVTGNKCAEELLKQLCKKNAFLFYDEKEKEYKIHSVLLDFLRTKQNFSQEQRHELYQRLGTWCLKQEDLFRAYSYLARAGEVRKILEHLNADKPIRNLYTDFEGADALFASAPKELLYEHPIAYLRYLFYSILKQKKEVTADLPQRLDELELYYQGKNDICSQEQNHIFAEILCVRKFTEFNHLDRMHSYNEQIVRLLNGRQSSIMLRVSEFTFGSPHYLYIYFRDPGSLKHLVSLLKENYSHTVFSDGCGMGSDSLAAAEFACETGDYKKALLESRKAVYKAATKSQQSIIICASFNEMRTLITLGEISKAQEILKQISAETDKLNRSVYNSMIELCKGYFYSVLDMPEEIPLWLKTGDMSSLSIFFGGMGFDMLTYEKVLLAQGEYLKLEALSDSFEEAFAIFQNRLGFIHNAIMLGSARSCLYGVKAGIPDLKRAISLARPDGIVLPFRECAVFLLPIFKAMPASDKQDAFVKYVMEGCIEHASNLKGRLCNKPKLTGREKEILELLAQGLSRNDIAERLTISPATVKTHLQTIYRKLGADGKISAIKSARMNGLITF